MLKYCTAIYFVSKLHSLFFAVGWFITYDLECFFVLSNFHILMMCSKFTSIGGKCWLHVGISTQPVPQDWWKNTDTGIPTWHGLSSDTHWSLLYGPWLDQEESGKGTNVSICLNMCKNSNVLLEASICTVPKFFVLFCNFNMYAVRFFRHILCWQFCCECFEAGWMSGVE